MKMRMVLLFAAAVVWTCLPTAVADWAENFDAYAPGTKLFGVGGWSGWGNDPNVAGVVTDAQSRSPRNSVEIVGDVDAVHPFTGYTTGQWVFTAYQYVPSALKEKTYFVMNNIYNPPTYQWTVEIHVDPPTGLVWDQLRDSGKTKPLPIIKDQWVEFKLLIDLTADTVSEYYGGQLLWTGKWTVRGGPKEIANVDLYAGVNIQTAVYWDDLSLVPEPASALLLLGLLALRRR